MKTIQKFGLVGIFGFLAITAFSNKKTKHFVTLKCVEDTVYFNKAIADTSDEGIGTFIVSYDLIIRNDSNKSFSIYEPSLTLGFKEDWEDYYLEIYNKIDGKLVPCKFQKLRYAPGRQPGVDVWLKPKGELKYDGTTNIYSMKEPGKYYIKAVMNDQYSFLGQSNLDSFVVIDTSAGK